MKILDKREVRRIGDNNHIGDIPKEKGWLLRLVDKCPLWLMIFLLFIFISIEMLGFAIAYSLISASPFMDSLHYSLFSALGEKVAASVPKSMSINRLISFQSILTNCIISFYMALVLYKLINIKPKLIEMEEHVVFDPETGTLRLRVANISRFQLTHVRVYAAFRIHMPDRGKHANAWLKLKTDNMNVFGSYVPWNIATKPFLPEGREKAQLDLDRFDKERLYECIPDLLNEKYRSDDEEKAKNTDYRNRDVVIIIKSPLFGTDWDYYKSFSAKDFVCGKLDSMENDDGTIDWSNWGKYTDKSDSYCEKCVFADYCSIIKRSQRYKTIS